MRMRDAWLVGLALAGMGAGDSSVRLIEAVKAGDRETVRALLKQRADVNAAESDGTTPLHWAARADDRETADLLMRAGANAKAANRYGVTPLSLAATNGSAALIESLLEAGADPEQPRSRGRDRADDRGADRQR